MAEIRDLLARLQSQSESRELPSALHLQPSVSSVVTTPSPAGPQPHHSSAILVCGHALLISPFNDKCDVKLESEHVCIEYTCPRSHWQ